MKYSYIEYETTEGSKWRAIPVDARVELYQQSVDIFDNFYWRFTLPVSREQFELIVKLNAKIVESYK